MNTFTISEMGPGWNIKNLEIDPPKIIAVACSTLDSGEIALKGTITNNSNSDDCTTIDVSNIYGSPTLETGDEPESYSVLVYGDDGTVVDLNNETYAPVKLYLYEWNNDDPIVGPSVPEVN